MWALLLVPVAAIAAYEAYKYGKQHPGAAVPSGPAKDAPVPGTQAAAATAAAAAVQAGAAGNPVPTGLGTVDGHGTGVLADPPVAGVPVDPSIIAQQAANIIAQQNAGGSAAAAEQLRQDIIAAMNTPATDRTPEQAALLSEVASLPTLGGSP